MLKLTYTESGLNIEWLTGSIDELITNRVILAMRTGQSIHVEAGRAAVLLPMAADLAVLKLAIAYDAPTNISLLPADRDYAEISFAGTWITKTANAEEGIFVADLSDRIAKYLHNLWAIGQDQLTGAPYSLF